MNNKNKGLVDNRDEEFILNESGTSVDNDMDDVDMNATEVSNPHEEKNRLDSLVTETHDPILTNDIASDEYSRLDKDAIQPHVSTFPDRKIYDDGHINENDV